MATTHDEVPTYVQVDGSDVFAILTRPTTRAVGKCIVFLSGGAWIPGTGRNRLTVDLARTMADRGFHGLRLDYHGVGESSGTTETFRLHEPFTSDVKAVATWAAREGMDSFVYFGTCFGARTALACAAEDPRTSGVALAALPVRDMAMGEKYAAKPTTWYLRRLVRPRVWWALMTQSAERRRYALLAMRRLKYLTRRSGKRPASDGLASSQVIDQLETLIERRTPLLLLYGEDDDYRQDFERARRGRLGEVLAAASDTIEIHVLPGRIHGLTRISVQRGVTESLLAWLTGHDPAPAVGTTDDQARR